MVKKGMAIPTGLILVRCTLDLSALQRSPDLIEVGGTWETVVRWHSHERGLHFRESTREVESNDAGRTI